jgi:hypothetical protein
MGFSPEEMEQLAGLIGNVVDAKMAEKNVVTAPDPVPDDPETALRKASEPWYFVHLADGRVIESQDSASTQMEGVQVIGRFPKGE